MSEDRLMTLHFIDGSKLCFEFPVQAMNAAAKDIMIGELMKSQHVVVVTEDSVLLFPIGNIKYIALAIPGSDEERPLELPKHTIRGARIRE